MFHVDGLCPRTLKGGIQSNLIAAVCQSHMEGELLYLRIVLVRTVEHFLCNNIYVCMIYKFKRHHTQQEIVCRAGEMKNQEVQ